MRPSATDVTKHIMAEPCSDDDFFVSTRCISRELRQQVVFKSSVGFSSNVLEVNGSNIMNFAQGEFSLVYDDLAILLPPPAVTAGLARSKPGAGSSK